MSAYIMISSGDMQTNDVDSVDIFVFVTTN